MIIGVDGNEANVDTQVGVSVYTLNILNYFQRQAHADLKFNVYIKNRPKSILPEQTKFFRYVTVPGAFAWSQIFLPLYLNTYRGLDLFFSPAHYAPRHCPVPLVVTIHDLAYFYYPEEFLKKDLYKLKNWTEYSIKKAARIIAVSKTTKKDIIKFYNVPENKIEVIYNGYEKSGKSDITEKNNTNEQIKDIKHYILYVGTIQPRKNLVTLLKAFASFRTSFPEYKLIIVGKRGWLYEQIYEQVTKLKIEDSVIFTGYLNDSEVIKLYKKALCFVFPSLYEGFGIPILEAMSHSCPVLASYTASLPEVGGEACLYFDPHNPAELTEKMIAIKERTSIRQDLMKKGREQIKQFSWEQCGKETLDVLVKTIQDKK